VELFIAIRTRRMQSIIVLVALLRLFNVIFLICLLATEFIGGFLVYREEILYSVRSMNALLFD